jgi:hypothetical protein
MKRIYVCLLIGFYCFLLAEALLAGGKESNASDEPVVLLARQVIEAIRNENVSFLIAVANPRGIYIGSDTDEIPKARFAEDLRTKQRTYCVIFNRTCLNDGASTSNRLSLRQLVNQGEVDLGSSHVDRHPSVVIVTVKRKDHLNNALFTLIFCKTKSGWVLQQIEYE